MKRFLACWVLSLVLISVIGILVGQLEIEEAYSPVLFISMIIAYPAFRAVLASFKIIMLKEERTWS